MNLKQKKSNPNNKRLLIIAIIAVIAVLAISAAVIFKTFEEELQELSVEKQLQKLEKAIESSLKDQDKCVISTVKEANGETETIETIIYVCKENGKAVIYMQINSYILNLINPDDEILAEGIPEIISPTDIIKLTGEFEGLLENGRLTADGNVLTFRDENGNKTSITID